MALQRGQTLTLMATRFLPDPPPDKAQLQLHRKSMETITITPMIQGRPGSTIELRLQALKDFLKGQQELLVTSLNDPGLTVKFRTSGGRLDDVYIVFPGGQWGGTFSVKAEDLVSALV